MKRLIAVLVHATLLGSLAGFTPAMRAESCTPITTLTASGSFTGEICVDNEAQIVRVTGVLTTKGNTYQIEATGGLTLEKSGGRPVYSMPVQLLAIPSSAREKTLEFAKGRREAAWIHGQKRGPSRVANNQIAIVYSISGSETIINPRASIIGNIEVSAAGDSLAQAVTRFASKVMRISLP